eukprot:TRINITY_DN2599_c0_g1_i1.p1 TRINITY_DN2599_c0_g1~~TRINITY_DN2599_c0_g1_i1.p1  ORF type:complete len:935 (+),score=275.43 TRINITY_DN2599_c0_g1_i1:59-2806(+)
MADDDEELAKAMALSLEEEEKEDMLQPQQSIEFERWDRDVAGADETEANIRASCTPQDPYVDFQFPPSKKSLWNDPREAEIWVCLSCSHENPVPAIRKPPTSMEEAVAMQSALDSVRCGKCSKQPVHFQMSRLTHLRPMLWLRPGERCEACEMVWGAQAMMFGAQDGGKELVSRQCTHFLRDGMSLTTVGNPWVVIRGEARPDDVMQGALGNCWWGGALSVVALHPHLIENLFVTKQYNPLGYYRIRLFHSGRWCEMLVDDALPCTQAWEGKVEGSTVHYSIGGECTFGLPRRHSLWVPLLEKASAKLHGSYIALQAGRTGEAMESFTGCTTLDLPLHVSAAARERQAARVGEVQERRTRALLSGGDPSEISDAENEIMDDDELWIRLLSFNEVGFLIAAGCNADAIGWQKQALADKMGLQGQHAYAVLDVRQVEHQGKMLRLLKLRNPWGDRSPISYRGDFGPQDNTNWTYGLKRELKAITASGEWMEDPRSVFWMTFADFRQYFYMATVCRLRTGWHEAGEKAWLMSDLGPGEFFEVSVFTKTRADISLWQERNRMREASILAKSTHVDVGFTVLRKKGGDGAEEEWECYHKDWHVKRSRGEVASCDDGELFLDGGYVYRVVPLSVGLMQASQQARALRSVRLRVLSNKPVEVAKRTATWRDIAMAMHAGARKVSRPRTITGTRAKHWFLKEGGGAACVVETADESVVLNWEFVDPIGCLSSRPGNQLSGITVVPPNTRIVLASVAYVGDQTQWGWACSPLPYDATTAACAQPNLGLHLELPVTAVTRSAEIPPPDPELLAKAPPPTPPGAEDDDAAELAAAIAMTSPDGGDDDDAELAAAIAMTSPDGGGGDDAAELAAAVEMSLDESSEDQEAELRKAIAMSAAEDPSTGVTEADAMSPEMLEALKLSMQQ